MPVEIGMYALVDCNNFFVSAERVFRPDLRDKPVCVLSNNDGCIVALSNEAKAIGLRRGAPVFKVQEILRRYDVTLFSSNFSLYAGMSSRVMRVLSDAYPGIEIYSIDEAFLSLDGIPDEEIEPRMRMLRQQIKKWTGIPVSIGVAATKTLAKVAGYYAKKFAGYKGVCLINTERKREVALQRLPIEEVWGIGRRYSKKLMDSNIGSAWDFTQMSEMWIRKNFSINGVKTRKELMGIPCMEASEVETKQSICTSSSFGEMVESKEELLSSIVHFTSACAQKLRKQHTVANLLSIFITTNRFNIDQPQYKQFATAQLITATADTAELIRYARQLLNQIYRPGFMYKKAGVIVSGIVDDVAIQQNIFDTIDNRDKRQQLFQTIDRINAVNGGGTVQFAIADREKSHWATRREHRSRNYLSDINELMEVK